MNTIYEIIEKIGEGQFGVVYKGINKITKEEVAIKVENRQKTKLLKREANIYLLLAKEEEFPNLKWYGSSDVVYYMVIDLLGVSLKELKVRSDEIPLIIIKRIAKKLVRIIEKVHKYQLLHRDIKPDNFLFDLVDYDKLYLIDFGLAKTFMTMSNNHVKEDTISGCVGTQEFVSLNVHERKLPSRRDDIESAVYIICYLFMPSEKWIKSEKEEDIKLFKQNLSKIENEKISEMVVYSQSLAYYDTPCYDKLIEIIETI